jgi:hypothetical protein
MKYGCIGIFKHCFGGSNQIPQFEERVVMTEAASYEEAKVKILAEFKEYAGEGTIFLNEYEITEIDDEKQVIEVASSMKVFKGTDEEYLERYYYDQRPISCDNEGWKHAWYNLDNQRSGCYNCQEVREGRLWKIHNG